MLLLLEGELVLVTILVEEKRISQPRQSRTARNISGHRRLPKVVTTILIFMQLV